MVTDPPAWGAASVIEFIKTVSRDVEDLRVARTFLSFHGVALGFSSSKHGLRNMEFFFAGL